MKNLSVAFISIIILWGGYVCAEDGTSGRFSITPKFGWLMLSKNLNIQDDYIYGVGAGYKFMDNWGIELEYLTSVKLETTLEEKGYMHGIGADTYLPYSGSVRLYSYNVNMLYRFVNLDRLESFLKFGVGGTQLSGKIEREERTFDYGAGGVYHFSYKQYKYYKTLNVNAGIVLKYSISDIFALRAEVYDVIMFGKAEFGKLKAPYHSIITVCGLQVSF